MKLRFLLFIPFLLPLAVFGQAGKDSASATPIKLSLKQAQEFALTNNLSVKNAMLDLETARKKVWETTAIGLPQANFNGNYQNIFKVPQFSFGGGVDYRLLPSGVPLTKEDFDNAYVMGQPVSLGVKENVTWDITVSQLIFSGEYIVGLQASRIFKEFSEQALTKTEMDTRESVSESYYLVLVAEENLGILRSNMSLLEKTLTEMEVTYKQGFIQETDVDQIRINKVNLQNMITTLDEQTRLAYRLLKFQMGLPLEQEVELTENLQSLIQTGNFKVWSEGNFEVQNNIDFKLMQTQENLNSLSLKREKSKFLPSVSAVYRHQELLNKPTFNFNFPNLVSVGLSFPLFSSGMRISRVQQARIALEKSSNSKDQVMQALIIDYEQSKSNYNKALNDYLSLKETVSLADKIYQKTLIKFKEGMATSMELTQAQAQFLANESNYFLSILNLFNAQSKLEKLLETE
ncbi:MAG: TolC family protein [Bacteroidales bacterium]